MIEVLGLYRNLRGDRVLPHNLVFISRLKMEIERVKTSNISDTMPDFFLQSFTMFMRK